MKKTVEKCALLLVWFLFGWSVGMYYSGHLSFTLAYATSDATHIMLHRIDGKSDLPCKFQADPYACDGDEGDQ